MEKLSIQTERLLLRNLKSSDLDDFHSYRSNPEVTKYQGFDVMSKEQCQTFIEAYQNKSYGLPGQWVQYGIENLSTGRLVGDCALKPDAQDPRIAEIGITISHLHQQQGYAKETMQGLMAWLFDHQHIHRIAEIVDAENEASIRLLQSLGFREEGHFIENIWFGGKWGSEYLFAMLKREWEAKK